MVVLRRVRGARIYLIGLRSGERGYAKVNRGSAKLWGSDLHNVRCFGLFLCLFFVTLFRSCKFLHPYCTHLARSKDRQLLICLIIDH